MQTPVGFKVGGVRDEPAAHGHTVQDRRLACGDMITHEKVFEFDKSTENINIAPPEPEFLEVFSFHPRFGRFFCAGVSPTLNLPTFSDGLQALTVNSCRDEKHRILASHTLLTAGKPPI